MVYAPASLSGTPMSLDVPTVLRRRAFIGGERRPLDLLVAIMEFIQRVASGEIYFR